MTSLAQRHLALKTALATRDQDPLKFWHHASPQSLEATKLLQDFDELYARAANKAGKTEWAAAVTVAICQKRKTLDGVPLPQWRGPVSALALSLDYTQQKLSVQQTVQRLLGKWPHRAKWKGDDVLSSLRIKPVDGDSDQSTWSVLTFMSQENRRSGLGARADVVWADEPPVEAVWREVRKAAHAGRRIVRLISATPILRNQWAWLQSEYGDPPRGQVTKHQDMAEIRWSLSDNKFLSQPEVDKLLRMFSREPILYDARVHGDYVDARGQSPFDIPTLLQMLSECKDGTMTDFQITRETGGDQGLVYVMETAEVEVFQTPKPNVKYYIVIDPSAGIKDPKHDPGGIHVLEMGSGDLVASYNGYIGSFGLGVLAGSLAKQYNYAIVDPENNSGWVEGVLRGLREVQYGNIAKELRLIDGEYVRRYGFTTSKQSRKAMITAVQEWIAAKKAGHPYAFCPCRRTIQCLLDVILDEDDKPVAAPGLHDEDLILRGQGLRRAVQNIGRVAQQLARARMTPDEELAALISGRITDTPDRRPMVGRKLLRSKRAPGY